jgi:thiamine biosynthesis lipoprotein
VQPTGARAGGGPFGIDNRWSYDNSGIWDRSYQITLEYGLIVAEVAGAVYEGGIRYGYILDPHTGWPVPNSPRSVSVTASSCTEAGLISTIALLHGAGAHVLLEEQGVRYWFPQ